MSADTSLVIARVGNKFIPAVIQAVENLYEDPKEDRWGIAQIFLESNRPSFDSPAAAIEYEYERDRTGEIYIEYRHPRFVALDFERQDIRELALSEV